MKTMREKSRFEPIVSDAKVIQICRKKMMHRTSIFYPIIFTVLTLLASCGKKDSPVPQQQILYQTNFDSDDGHWFVGASQYGIGAIQNGFYKISNKSATESYSSFTNYAFFNNLTADHAMEIRLSVAKTTNNEQAFAGLIWNKDPDGDRKYVFGFYNNGYYEIFGYAANGQYQSFRSSTFSDAIQKNGENVLQIAVKSGTLYFSINGTEVYSMPSGNYSLDNSGFFMDGGCVVMADYYKAFLL